GYRAPRSSGITGARLPLYQPGQHSTADSAGSGAGQAFSGSSSKDRRAGNAAARSHARSAGIGPEETARSRGAGAQGDAGGEERTPAGQDAANSPASGQDECVFHGKLGNANHGSRAAEGANGWLRRSQRRTRVGQSQPSSHDRAGGLV